MTVRLRFAAFIAAGLAVAIALAFFVSPHASSQPDGLAKVAADHGLGTGDRPHALEALPTAGYAVKGVDDRRLSTGLAGLIGVVVTFCLAGGLFVVVRRTSAAPPSGA